MTLVGATRLPRGCMRIETSRGPIQYGATPETIKDSMALPGGVPEVYVVPPVLFSTERGLSLAELEFPAYFNFFVRKRKTTIVCRRNHVAPLRRLVSESVFGPSVVRVEDDYPPGNPCVADLRRELDYFRKVPYDGKRRMELEDLVEFVPFGRDGRASVLGGVEVAIEGGDMVVEEGGVERARVGEDVPLTPDPPRFDVQEEHPFEPPLFGATTIGAGHGFDPGEKTSGFILWVNRRGVLVDPPVDSTDFFAANDLSPRLVDSLILTHCHADHDAGTLQKLLQEGRVTVYTTRTVMQGFVRKYQPLTGLPLDRFLSLFDFVPVRIGEPVRIHGAEFLFRYSLHSIPTVGFEVYFAGKSFAYTSDFLNDPRVIESMHSSGVISADRRDELLNFPWHHTVIFHEAGVPPIHTAVSFLAELPDEVKQRIYLVHTSRSNLPPGCGLEPVREGIANSLVIDVRPPLHSEAIELLDALAHIDLFAGMRIEKAREFLAVTRTVTFKAGDRMIADGTPGDLFYIILTGKAAVVKGGRQLKVYSTFDYIGETAIILDQPRNADVVALTDVRAIVMENYDFLCLLRGTAIPAVFRRIAANRATEAWAVLEETPSLRGLSAGQKTQLQAILHRQEHRRGEVLLREGERAEEVYLVESGEIELSSRGQRIGVLGRGRLVGDPVPHRRRPRSAYSGRAQSDLIVYSISHQDMASFLDRNPGLLARFLAVEGAGDAPSGER